MRKIGVLLLLGVSAFLGACFPTLLHRNQPPPIWIGDPAADRAANPTVLVLAISEAYRSGAFANLSKIGGYSRYVQAPMFVPELELKELSKKLHGFSTNVFFAGVFGGWTEKSSEQTVEVCVIWPDGRFLALGGPTTDKWQRETRGTMTIRWREQLLESLSTVELFKTLSPPDVCPYAEAKLKWDIYERRRVIEFLKQAAVLQ